MSERGDIPCADCLDPRSCAEDACPDRILDPMALGDCVWKDCVLPAQYELHSNYGYLGSVCGQHYLVFMESEFSEQVGGAQ